MNLNGLRISLCSVPLQMETKADESSLSNEPVIFNFVYYLFVCEEKADENFQVSFLVTASVPMKLIENPLRTL